MRIVDFIFLIFHIFASIFLVKGILNASPICSQSRVFWPQIYVFLIGALVLGALVWFLLKAVT